MLLGGAGLHQREVGVVLDAAQQVVLAHIAGVDHRLGGQQTHLLQGLGLGLVVRVGGKGAGGLAGFQMVCQLLQPGGLGTGSLVAGLGGLGLTAQTVADHLQVGQDQLHVDGLNVPDGVHRLRLVHVLHHMDDVVVVKAAHHMDNGVAFPDMAQELVAQARALGGTLHQAGNVHKLHNGRGLFVGFPDLGQLVQPRVRHRDNAGVGLDGAEGIVGCLGVLGVGQRIEQSGLAHIGQSDDT